MRYKIGDTVCGKRIVSKNSDGYFCEKSAVWGKIVYIPNSRRYAVVDTGLYRECFCFADLKFIQKKGCAL